MANWNLSVDLKGNGNDLSQALKSSAKRARSLGTAAKTAKTEVKELGLAAEAAGKHIKTLGTEARTAARRLNSLGDNAQTATRRLNRYGDAAQSAHRHVTSLGENSRTTGRQLARMSGQIDTAVRDLARLATAAQRADSRMARMGLRGSGSLRRYRDEASRAHSALKSLAGVGATLGLALGVHEVIEEGGQYQQAMNAFGATTGATQMQMKRASATANQLGNDLKLPGATAADAAEGMVELAKAGFRTDQAISATRSSVILASAAQVNAADSAKYLGDMMDQFGMGADQSAKAADTLAATANAASGEIIDIYYAMKYAGPVAHGLGLSMQETAAAVGMLGKAGILGQTAGTTLRGMMANLAAPTPQMIEGLKAMGIEAWDAQGNFKGLRNVIDGLSKAQHHMTQQDFAAAVKKSMGKPAMSGAIALAHQGVESYDNMLQAAHQVGAATDIAAAKGKGLAGAMLQLGTQAKQTGLTIYQGMAPGLEFLTRGVTAGLSEATPKIEHFFNYFNDLATLFGPEVSAAASREFAGIADAASNLAGPLKDLGEEALADFLHVLVNVGGAAVHVLENLAAGVQPVLGAFSGVAGESDAVSSSLDIVVAALDLAATAAEDLSGVLIPIGQVVGGLVSAFGSLPGPVQQFVLAALLVRRIQGPMVGLANTVNGRVRGAFQSLNQQMAVQRSLAGAAGMSLSRYGAAMATLQARVPIFGQMGAAFRTASAQGAGFAGTLRGVGAASMTATRAIGSGLMGALGGPVGLAITAATVGLGYLASRQQAAAAAAAEHRQQVSALSEALRQSNGAVDDNVRAVAAQTLMSQKAKSWYGDQKRLVDLAREAKVPFSQLVDAYTGQGTSLSALQRELSGVVKEHTKWTTDLESGAAVKAPDRIGKAAQALSQGLGGLSGDFSKAAADAKSYNEAVKGAQGGETAYGRLKDAVAALADKTGDADQRTRALRDALDLLSGGSVSLQAAQARVNEAITQANEAMQSGINKADGFGKALVNANGTLDTTTKNGQALFSTFNTIADGASNASIAAYDFAQSQGKSLPQSLAAAQKEMQTARDSAVKLAQGYGLSADQAGKVADSLGLIPGQVSILLETKGVDSTLAELLAVQAEFQKMPTAKTIRVDALGEEAKRELEDLGYKIKLIPGTREYKITAPTKAARSQLDLLISEMAKVPPGKDVRVDVHKVQAVAGLNEVQAQIKKTPSAKSVKVSTLNSAAIAALNAVGLKTKQLPDGHTAVYTANGQALGSINSVARALASLNGRTASTTITNTIITNSKTYRSVHDITKANGGIVNFADGGLTGRPAHRQHFANGTENHLAEIAPAGAWRIWAEDETGGEAYIPLALSKRRRSRAIAEETIRRLGGDPRTVQWNADGNVTDWRYDPTTGSLYSASDAGQAGHKTKKVKVKGKHGKTTTKEVDYFDVGAVEKKIKSAAKATTAWNKDLEKVADRAGGDVAEALAAMGEDGMKIAHKMATGSTKYINDMSKALRDLQKTAKASLTDYTRQLGSANTLNKKFSDNLAKLAAEGYGDLAQQLAAQNDEAAQQLADAAVKDPKKAGQANKAAKTANTALTADEVSELVSIIAAIKNPTTGIHQVAAATSLGEDEIISVANKAKGQISKSLGTRAVKFLADLGRANAHLSYADGGIRAGMYAAQGSIIRFAEPSTGGEAYLPLGAGKRSQAMPVLQDVARRFGVGLTDASGGRQVVIVRSGDTINVPVTAVRTGATASDIGSQVGRSYRRARRGGVAARAA
ncbi:phage tail tape measure protein (plasmid) [Streptomyces seoulensis]|uniref:Phage tail tape measure protein n=1 Tax=Streptomyces seoulensis TaxID=73044 RepID=A0A4P6U3A3_STRSO|nr:phage tail tape measure protein [Streptomyces seoulensis]QBJ94420.1 phage tail tape measure protein [Streptomyces seoulensis]